MPSWKVLWARLLVEQKRRDAGLMETRRPAFRSLPLTERAEVLSCPVFKTPPELVWPLPSLPVPCHLTLGEPKSPLRHILSLPPDFRLYQLLLFSEQPFAKQKNTVSLLCQRKTKRKVSSSLGPNPSVGYHARSDRQLWPSGAVIYPPVSSLCKCCMLSFKKCKQVDGYI